MDTVLGMPVTNLLQPAFEDFIFSCTTRTLTMTIVSDESCCNILLYGSPSYVVFMILLQVNEKQLVSETSK